MSWRYLARAYLDLQHLRIACEARIRKMRERDVPEKILAIMENYYQTLRREERQLLKEITRDLKEHPLWKWCSNVKGLGPVACLIFLGFISASKADTAGKAKAYFGLIPGAELRSGQKARINPEGKGRIWLLTRNVIMRRDDYYYPLYQQKKQYYMETERKVFLNGEWITWPPFKEILEDPSNCPRYEECTKRLVEKAKRVGRKPKKPPCRGHLDAMAKRWLSGILVSNAAELMRRAEGLPVDNYLRHRGYIKPKPVSEPINAENKIKSELNSIENHRR